MNSLKIRFLLFISILIFCKGIHASDKTTIYLFPGQGSDYRIFHDLRWKENYDTVYMHLPVPLEDENLKEYALRFLPFIDTTEDFILVGVSLGGMICTELADTLDPMKTILISSAKHADELPWQYTFQKSFGLYKAVPKKTIKKGALLAQSVVEPDSKNDELFGIMLAGKDPLYLKRTIDMIINWEKSDYNNDIIHIHGDKDHTIPIRNVKADYIIEDGSHMMVLTRADEISEILGKILE